MAMIEREIVVRYKHRIYFTHKVFHLENSLLSNLLLEEPTPSRHKIIILLDESLHHARPTLHQEIQTFFTLHPHLDLVCPPIIQEGGERIKNSYFHVSEIHSHIDRFHIDRHSFLLAIGGGALLDMVGLAAATAHRGVRHIRIPTTTLSQDDSGVGVKNGINAFGKKNFIGTFAPPFAVINDFDLLSTLPERDKRAGFSEAVKVGLIRDASFIERLEQDAAALRHFDPAAMEYLIQRCAELHVNHIATSGDPFEFGSARPLDFGHWAAHKLEQLSDYSIRHGEAVAIGIAIDVLYSRNIGWLTPESTERILKLLLNLGFSLFAHELLHQDSKGNLVLLKGLEEFREHLGGILTITLLKGIGQGTEINEIDIPKMESAIRELQTRFG